MNDPKRRFRPRPQRNGFRPRNNGGQNSNGHFHSSGNGAISRNNGSMLIHSTWKKLHRNINS